MPKMEAGIVTLTDDREIELKFALTMENMLRLLEAAPWQEVQPGAVKRLHSTYFDTPDHRLRRSGFSLRIRDDGTRKIQTVKTLERGGDAFAERGEWSCAVRSALPNLRTRAAAVLRPALADVPQKPVVSPIFTVDVTRHKYDVICDGASIEVAVDSGEIVAGARRESFCELELELKAGSKAALFAQAAAILEAVPIRLDPQAKAERGFALLAGGNAVQRAERTVLTADMSLTTAFQHIARGCLRHLIGNETAFWQGRPPEAVHQVRVAIRRLRAAMAAFKSVCTDAMLDPLRSELRWVASEMGPARELDVYIAGLIEDGEAAYGADPAYQAMLADCYGRRERAYDQAVAALASARFRNLILTLTQWIECGVWLQGRASTSLGLIEHAAGQMSRRWKKVRRVAKHHTKLDATARHEWRIEVKKLRYAVDFFLSLFIPAEGGGRRKETPPYQALKHLTGLQDCLGALNDLAEAERHSPLSEFGEKLIAKRAENRPQVLLAVDMDCAALAVLMPFWKARKS